MAVDGLDRALAVLRGERDFEVVLGDCLGVMAGLPEASVEVIVCDPPYNLGFMGKRWDRTGIAFRPETWAACLRVLKPGGHLVAFGGQRTHHRIWCAIEDAGFEIRTTLQWVSAHGFPKGQDVALGIDRLLGRLGDRIPVAPGIPKGKQRGIIGDFPERSYTYTRAASEEARRWEGWNTALKPACEPVCLARKPLSERTVAKNVLRHGTGGVNIEACRVPTISPRFIPPAGNRGDEPVSVYEGRVASGRWPAELILGHGPGCRMAGMRRVRSGAIARPPTIGHSGQIGPTGLKTGGIGGYADPDGLETIEDWECEPGCPVRILDDQSGDGRSPEGRPRSPDPPAGATYSLGRTGGWQTGYGDEGGASRVFLRVEPDPVPFFYASKVSTSERDRGLESLPAMTRGEATGREDGRPGTASPAAGPGGYGGRRNSHTTVKPLDLMAWLVRLVTPRGGVVLDPFAGSGSTLIAALREGFRCVGIEKEEEYWRIARRRIEEDAPILYRPRSSSVCLTHTDGSGRAALDEQTEGGEAGAAAAGPDAGGGGGDP